MVNGHGSRAARPITKTLAPKFGSEFSPSVKRVAGKVVGYVTLWVTVVGSVYILHAHPERVSGGFLVELTGEHEKLLRPN